MRATQVILSLVLVLLFAVATASPAVAAIPTGCTVGSLPPSSQSAPLAEHTTFTLSGWCPAEFTGVRFRWNTGIDTTALVAQPWETTTYTVTPWNDDGDGAPLNITLFVRKATVAPAGCNVLQDSDTQVSPVTPGTGVFVRVVCSGPEQASFCVWRDRPDSTNCEITIVAPAESQSFSVIPSNGAGASPAVTGIVHVAGTQNKVVVNRSNITLNGLPVKSPVFVSMGDLLKFDASLDASSSSTSTLTGLGLCLHYASAFLSEPQVGNFFLKDLLSFGSASAAVCDKGGSWPTPGTDAKVSYGWIANFGNWPDAPLPIKLYDAEFTVGSMPAGTTIGIGWAANELTSGFLFSGGETLVVCSRPKVSLVSQVDAMDRTSVHVTLTVDPIPGTCAPGGAFPVSAELAVGLAASVVGTAPSAVTVAGNVITVPVPANGSRTTTLATLTLSQPLGQVAVQPPVHLTMGTGNYVDEATGKVPRPAVGGSGGSPTDRSSQSLSLSVTSGQNIGTLKSDIGGVDCRAICDHTFPSGTRITLLALPDPDSKFVGWLGDCVGRSPCTIDLTRATSVSAAFASQSTVLSADVNADARYDALTDGVLALRYMFGLTGASLVQGVGALDGAQVGRNLDALRPLFDIDGDGRLDALTDGVILVRYLFGLRGPELLSGITSTGARRTSAADVEAHLRSLTP